MAIEFQTQAILLAVRDWSSADRMVTLFSREYGIITAMAYGARKTKSKMGGSLQSFVCLNLQLFSGKGMDTIRQCEIQNAFREIREDLTRLAYANFIAELTTGLWPERQSQPEVFDCLLAICELLAKRSPRIAALAGAWQLLSLAGFQPETECCVRCGRRLDKPSRFNYDDGGALCAVCSLSSDIKFDESDKELLEKLLKLELSEPGNFSVKKGALNTVESLLYGYVKHQLERPLRSLDFIRQISAL